MQHKSYWLIYFKRRNKPNMRIPSILLFLFYLAGHASMAQSGDTASCYNLGFEKNTSPGNLPDNWLRWGQHGYILQADSVEKHSGRYSLRLEGRSMGPKDFGCIAIRLPANYSGKEIELRAWMKLKEVSQPIGLMLRIEDKTRTIAFENMEKQGIKGTIGWTQYSIKLEYPKNAHIMYVGAILSGTGVLWTDNFELYIDGKNMCGLKANREKESKAELDHAFDAGSGISTIPADPLNCENLALLGRVWGFLKYYHPAVRKGDYNWDYELFRILPKILAAPNAENCNEVLNNWVLGLGPLKVKSGHKRADKNIRIHPDLHWINDTLLGKKLCSTLREIEEEDRRGPSYYLDAVKGVGNPDFVNENPYTNMKYPDAGFRLLSLYRYWNTIQYFFPYKYLIEEDWNRVLKTYMPVFLQEKDQLDYELAALSLICRVHDSHAVILNPSLAMNTYRGLNYAPVEITFIENKAVVTGFLNGFQPEHTDLQIGDLIETINGRPLGEYLKELLPYTPASNLPTKLRNLAINLLRTSDTIISVSRLRGEMRDKVSLVCYPASKVEPYKRFHSTDTCFRMVSPGIACLYPGTVRNKYLSSLMPEIQKSKGLIIDMRCYPSDFIVYTLGRRLVFRPHTFVKFSVPDIQKPGLFRLGGSISIGSFHLHPYKGKLIILVNEYTQSQAEFTTMAFKQFPRTLVIGSTTAGADGNVSEIVLPGGMRTMISGLGVYYPDGSETQRIGIVPDIELKPTVKGIREHRDELMEKAIETINKNN
jgi:hypothetical protein